VKSVEFRLTESSNGKLARNNIVKVEVKSISSGQRKLFLYLWRVSVKLLLIMSLRTCFMARNSTLRWRSVICVQTTCFTKAKRVQSGGTKVKVMFLCRLRKHMGGWGRLVVVLII